MVYTRRRLRYARRPTTPVYGPRRTYARRNQYRSGGNSRAIRFF